MRRRKTSFRWYYYRHGKKHLTKKARMWLSRKRKAYLWKQRRLRGKNAIYHIRGSYKKRGKKGEHPFWIEVIAVVPRDMSESDVKSLAMSCVDRWFEKEGFFVPIEVWKVGFEGYTDEDEKIEVVKWGH